MLLLCEDGVVGIKVVFLEELLAADHEVEQGVAHAEEGTGRHDDDGSSESPEGAGLFVAANQNSSETFIG